MTRRHSSVLRSTETFTPNQCRIGPHTPLQTGQPNLKHDLNNIASISIASWKQNIHTQPSLLPQKPKALAAGTADAPTHWPICYCGVFFQTWSWFPGWALKASLTKTILFYRDTDRNPLEDIFWPNWKKKKKKRKSSLPAPGPFPQPQGNTASISVRG